MTSFSDMPGHLIRRLHQISVSEFARGMSDAGLDLTPVQFAALSSLAERPGVDQATLAGLIAQDRATLGGVLDRLETKGAIRREVSPEDKRARIACLTEEGEALLGAAQPVVLALQGNILTGLSPRESETFLSLLRKAADATNRPGRTP